MVRKARSVKLRVLGGPHKGFLSGDRPFELLRGGRGCEESEVVDLRQRVRAKKVPGQHSQTAGPSVGHAHVTAPRNTGPKSAATATTLASRQHHHHRPIAIFPISTPSAPLYLPLQPASSDSATLRVLAPNTVAMATDLWYVAPSSASGQLGMPPSAALLQLHHLSRVHTCSHPL